MDWSKVDFDWNQARAFLVTAQEGSFSAAARSLGMSQPTLGRQVSALEQALGVTLFERHGHGLLLTEAGRALLSVVSDMGDAAARLSMTAQAHTTELEGHVVLSASEIDATFLLPPAIKALRQTYPSISLDILVSNEVSDLKHREADIALRSFRPTEADLIARRLRSEPVWLYGSAAYAARLQGLTPQQAFQQINIISFDPEFKVAQILNEKGWDLGKANFGVSTRFQLLQWQLCRQHMGLCFLTQSIGDADPELQRVLTELGPPFESIELWLVSHRELRTSPRVRAVFDVLVAHLAEDRPL